MFRSVVLSTLTVLALDGATTSLMPVTGMSITAESAAADFTGRIRRIRIKARRSGSGFKVSARTSGDSSTRIAAAKIELSDAETGAELDAFELEETVRARLVYAGTLGKGGADISSYRAYPQLSEDVESDLSLDDEVVEVLAQGLTFDESGEAVAGPLKLRGSVLADGSLEVVISHEDKDWNPDSISGVVVADAEGTSSALDLEDVRQSFQTIWKDSTAISDRDLVARVVLYDADGNTLDSLEQAVDLSDDGSAAPGLSRASLKETKKGNTRLVTWTDSDQHAAALEVELTNGETALMTVDDTPMLTVRGYESDIIEFDSDEDGAVYNCQLNLLDVNGNPIGEALDVALTMPAYSADTDTDGTHWQTITDSSDQVAVVVGFYVGEDGASIGMSYSGDDVQDVGGVSFRFDEPFEGPAPSENEIQLEFNRESSKWTQQSPGNVPALYVLTTTLVTPDGEEIDTTTATGGGTGPVFRASSHGMGTRTPVVQALNTHQELL